MTFIEFKTDSGEIVLVNPELIAMIRPAQNPLQTRIHIDGTTVTVMGDKATVREIIGGSPKIKKVK